MYLRHGLAYVAVVALVTLSTALCPPSRQLCKTIPGDPGWPSLKSWDKLNDTIDGHLLRVSPPAAVCHLNYPEFNEQRCSDIQAAWKTHGFHVANPVSTMWNQWNNDTCLPDAKYSCSGEGYPVYTINASATRHVKAGVDFARRHNIRLVVKSTGHDYVGRSVAPNSLSIWTRNLQGMKSSSRFSTHKCEAAYKGPVVKAGSGTLMQDLYKYTALDNRTVVGGTGGTVSAGGYITGGGHSILSAKYGLAADQVVEMEAVTPTGDMLVLNECQNQDLFWAMRGGGGSTFGVMTSVTMKTHPSPKMSSIVLVIATPSNSSASAQTFDVVAYVLSQYPSLGDRGVTGYSFIFSSFPNPSDGGASKLSGMLITFSLVDEEDPAVHAGLWKPITDHVSKTWPGFFAVTLDQASHGSQYDWFLKYNDTSAAGDDQIIGSWLLSRSALTDDASALKEAFKGFTDDVVSTAYLVSGKGVTNAHPAGGSDSVLPAWRKAYVHATCGVNFLPQNKTSLTEAYDQITRRVEALRKLAPDMGAYMNEANAKQPQWQKAFWGEHYSRLLEIKRRVDPFDVLWCEPCVGNERWKTVGDKLCTVDRSGTRDGSSKLLFSEL